MGLPTPDKKRIIESYAPEKGVHQVGWVSSTVKENSGQFKDVDIVEINFGVASVSEEGAQIKYTERTVDDIIRPITFPRDVTGFTAASSLRLEIIRGMDVKEALEMRPIDLTAAASERDASQIVASTDELENVAWIEDPQELLAELKRRLEAEGVEDYYKASYYGLNAAIGHAGVRAYLSRIGLPTDQSPPFVADPNMQETTWWQLANARSVVVNLGQIIEEDRAMQRDLAPFSDLGSASVPEAFVASREIVHEAEARASEVARRKLIIPRHVFLPPGFRPSGRSWPYMNATLDVSDERAFGQELAALKDNDIEPVESELRKEINETKRRLEYAQAAVRMLRGLLAAEKAAK